jgi:DNA-binding LytR/AlgR family response regulator
VSLHCLVVDDEPLARKLLVDYIGKIPSLTLVGTCSNPLEAREVLLSKKVDILFLDIQMPEITGIGFLKTLKTHPMVILTTAYSEYALEGYELDVVDYLLKPITFERFLKAIEKATSRKAEPVISVVENKTNEAEQAFVFVKDGTKIIKVKYDDILYVEGLKDYVLIHTPTKKITSLQRMKAMETELPGSKFIRIHNSFIVALDAIESIQKNEVLIGGKSLPISDGYRKSFMEFIDRYKMG